MLHPFEIASIECDAVLAPSDPVFETMLPLLSCDTCNFTLNCNNKVVHCSIVMSSQLLLKSWKQKEVCWRQVRGVGRVPQLPPGIVSQVVQNDGSSMHGRIIHMQQVLVKILSNMLSMSDCQRPPHMLDQREKNFL